jgi:nitroreductase
MMDVIAAIHARRSIRRYDRRPVDRAFLLEMVNAARVAPSAVNLQPIEYIVVDDEAVVSGLFGLVRMGALLPEKDRPTAEVRPAAFVAVLVNTAVMKSGYEYDVGCAVQNALLVAVAHGLGTCFIRNINRDEIRTWLAVPAEYEIDSIIAVGHPAQRPEAEDTESSNVRYYLDKTGSHRVPKRTMAKILHLNRF